MARILPFRRRPQRIRFWPDDRVTAGGIVRDTLRWLARLRPIILGAILLSIWPASDPALIEPPTLLSTAPEKVSANFTRCGRGRGFACVVDGDTFRLGQRRIRIIGIDAPETHPARCAEEARLGERATRELEVLLSAGPFEMRGWAHNRRDRYGRELMAVERRLPGGRVQSIGAELREMGLARRYDGGFRSGWC